ncbi:MAG: LysR family transcriptional regulator substrate-binding protein, partial [Sedimentisphaerales bacterium]|nr:LysR family transcriptional regulator substrate-binding protein [Sedimentisphaerales bacterium]
QKRPLELTAAGEIFYRAAKDIVDRYELLKSELNSLKSAAQARINVGAIYSIGMHSLPAYLKRFMLKRNTVNVHVEYFNAEKIYELVLAGELDIGLVAVPRMDKRLEVYEFEDEPLVLACGAKHPLAALSQIDIHKLQFERFISFEEGVPTRDWIDGIFQRYSIVIRPVMEFDNIETVKRAVEINSGVSILPRTAILQELAAGTIKAIDFENERFVRPTGIIIRKDKVLSPDARYLIDLLRRKS